VVRSESDLREFFGELSYDNSLEIFTSLRTEYDNYLESWLRSQLDFSEFL